jgi:hypothetical protein
MGITQSAMVGLEEEHEAMMRAVDLPPVVI